MGSRRGRSGGDELEGEEKRGVVSRSLSFSFCTIVRTGGESQSSYLVSLKVDRSTVSTPISDREDSERREQDPERRTPLSCAIASRGRMQAWIHKKNNNETDEW